MPVALTREISPAFERCELTHLERQPIDLEKARRQHEAYEELLRRLGCRVERLAAEPDLPDSVFVEDAAVVLDELAVIARPGAPSRRAETASAAAALARYRPLVEVKDHGILDGGDVLVVGKRLYVGLSSRTNRNAIAQLSDATRAAGYTVTAVPFSGCLHLKSAVTRIAANTLLANPSWVDVSNFEGMRILEVDPGEPEAANALAIGADLVFPTRHERTAEVLVAAGLRVHAIDVSELLKAEAGVTCCSLVFEQGRGGVEGGV